MITEINPESQNSEPDSCIQRNLPAVVNSELAPLDGPAVGAELREKVARSERTFRKEPESEIAREQRADTLAKIQESERVTPVTKYSVLYEYDVPIQSLPAALEGFSVLQLSDIHFHRNKEKRASEFRALVDHINKLNEPIDLVIITGDIITDNARDLSSPNLNALRELRPESQRYFVLGNHDFYGDAAQDVRKAIKHAGYTDLSNHHLKMTVDGAPINFYGVDDYLEGDPKVPYRAADNADETNIILTHNLDVLQARYPDAFDLVLSGHLHSGETSILGIDGTHIMELCGYAETVNSQRKGWDHLSDRALSYISPGQARHIAHFNTDKPGAVIHRLTALEKEV